MGDARFERLYSDHARELLAFLLYRTGDRPLSEDLLADTFERALRARRRFDRRRASEKTWLYAIALNCLRDHGRRRDAEARAVDRVGDRAEILHAGTRPEPFEEVERRDALARALETLTADEREAIALRYGAELTMPEMAAACDEPLTTVEGRVYRALRKLRGELG